MERLLLCALVFGLPAFDAADARNASRRGHHRAWSLETRPSPGASSGPQEERRCQRLHSRGEWRACGPASAATLPAHLPVDLPRWPSGGSPEANARSPAGGREASRPPPKDSYDSVYWGDMMLFVLFLLAILGCCCFCLASGRWPLTASLQEPERHRLGKTDPLLRPQGYGAVADAHSTSQSADDQDLSCVGGETTSLLDSATGQEDALPSGSLQERTECKSVSDATTVDLGRGRSAVARLH